VSFRRVNAHGTEVREAPALETARLRLRAFRADDFEALAALWRDPAMTRHILGRPATDEESWLRLLRYAGHWALQGFGIWAVEEKSSGRYVGELGFGDFRRELDAPLAHPVEGAWVIATAAQGRGYAREAMTAALAWLDAHRPPEFRISALIAPENAASLRLAARLGFVEAGQNSIRGLPTLVLERERPDA
jgi:RimJ/RimL family protein N-acetyltransferase